MVLDLSDDEAAAQAFGVRRDVSMGYIEGLRRPGSSPLNRNVLSKLLGRRA
jgi:hypothetical protein